MVILVTLGLKFYARSMLSVAAGLIGLIAGYIYAIGMLSADAIVTSWDRAAAFALPQPFKRV